MKLWTYVGETVRLVLKNGRIIQGKAWDWNDPEDVGDQEILIGDQSYGESQIKTIEVLKLHSDEVEPSKSQLNNSTPF